MNLTEARKKGKLKEFIAEREGEEVEEGAVEKVIERMAKSRTGNKRSQSAHNVQTD